MAFHAKVVATAPFDGQKPGTSGLRKKTKQFMEGLYLHNFVQATFDSLPAEGVRGSTIVVSGDGRYYTPEAIQIITKIAAANGVARVWIGENGLLSTPAVSAIIRRREGGVAFGGFILTASHNPGGPEEDFGIKYNAENGGPATESLTNSIFEATKTISRVLMVQDMPDVDLTTVGEVRHTVVLEDGTEHAFSAEVISATQDYVSLQKELFDFPAIARLLARDDFSFVYDSMHGVAGPYAKAVFVDELGADAAACLNATPQADFGGGHPDPNLVYAHDLVKTMGLTPTGQPAEGVGADGSSIPSFGAAADGDADRNMILGRQFFVTPSDSVAIIAACADAIPFFAAAGGLRGVARSMPTSAALDRVAAAKGLRCFEVPTGWKFFGNLMDSAEKGGEVFNPFLCGEESFGTGSDHVREKDGLWAVLAWLSILAQRNADPAAPFVGVEDIVREHWATYGRNYYSRYDYEGVASEGANAMMEHLRARIQAFTAAKEADSAHTETCGAFQLCSADEFNYTDPVDGSVAAKQGIRFGFTDGSRVVWRLSGTGSVGATVRMYLEKYEPGSGDLGQAVAGALGPLVDTALELCQIASFTGRESPTVIT
jgi:phosphoglucomutase